MDFHGTWTKEYWGMGQTCDPNSKVIKGSSEVTGPKWSRYAKLLTVSTFFDRFSWDLITSFSGDIFCASHDPEFVLWVLF